jgi:uncharacterized protein
MRPSPNYLIDYLHLMPHPEGGYFREAYRATGSIPRKVLPTGFTGDRNFSTAIYFLLEKGDFSAFHRIRSDECWHFYEGGTLLIHVIAENGRYQCIRLGRNLQEGDVFQVVVPAGAWFASEPAEGSAFSLVGCTVAPGFDFEDFEMAKGQSLAENFPDHHTLIRRLCRY